LPSTQTISQSAVKAGTLLKLSETTMLLTITASFSPATDLGYLLHKNPSRAQSIDLGFGKAHVFYPEIRPERCTAALLLEVDPIGLVRGRHGPAGADRKLEEYVNDRPYAASSFLSVAMARVFSSAMAGISKERPELAARELPLQAHLAALPCHGGEALLRRLFEPLGYRLNITQALLDESHPEWGLSPYFSVTLGADRRLADLLTHIYVLVPVLDDDKHYWVGDDEVEKLLRRGEGWLDSHPERDLIVRRYLRHQRSLARAALERLTAEEEREAETLEAEHTVEEQRLEGRIRLGEQRIGAVLAVLKQSSACRILDLGCGEGHLLAALLKEKSFEEIVGMDVSHRSLERASDRLRLERMPERQRERVRLLHGSLMYRDRRLEGYDAAALVEVIEHLDPPRLRAMERNVFEFARPRTVVVTTPNSEYNVRFEGLPAGRFRHRDHRFEWTRAEFEQWAQDIGGRFGYEPRFLPIGNEDAAVGAPTQMAVFSR
jgi:3' terminal RNA ribose 2'-O-methyltransferase Hen1